jgi:hypothetical protein
LQRLQWIQEWPLQAWGRPSMLFFEELSIASCIKKESLPDTVPCCNLTL